MLPAKRTLKPHDRVCERHFEDEMIVKHWETNINGVRHLTPRDKPKLRDNAIPSKNLSCKDDSFELSEDLLVASLKRKPKEKIVMTSPKKAKKEVDKEIEHAEESPVARKEVDKEIEAAEENTIEAAKSPATSKEKEETDRQQVAERLALFEILYDEAFDVTLPGMLWGIHRDPDRKFIVFSEFDNSSMSTSHFLHITDDFICKTFVNGELNSTKTLLNNDATTEGISTLLDDLDKKSLTSS